MSTKTPEMYLSPDQRALLLAALNSNSPLSSQPRTSSMNMGNTSQTDGSHKRSASGSVNQQTPSSDMNNNSFDASIFSDADAFGDVDYSFDTSLADPFNFDFGNDTPAMDGAEHEKRKLSSDDDSDSDDPHENEPKRREGDDKTAKKPGRKPIQNEPTSKRKAQNRAAQRAFRERKEKHLKDLEQKVSDLEKISENTTQENKALKDQVDKLQGELKEYRKRFSLGGIINRSPSNSVSNSISVPDNLGTTGGFNFDFPLFGNFSQPGHNVVNGNKTDTNGSSSGRGSMSPTNYKVSPGGILEIDRTNRNSISQVSPHGSNTNSPAINRTNSDSFMNTQSPIQVHRVSLDAPRLFNAPSNDILSDLFSPSILNAVNHDPMADYMNKGAASSANTTPHMSSLFSFSDSPSASSVSQQSSKNGHGATSSCGTSPEADANSPPANKIHDGTPRLNSISEEVKSTPINSNLDNSFQWLAAQNGGSFDPMLFNDYRDPTDPFSSNVGMSYFDDAFPSAFDIGMPPTPAPVAKQNKPQAPGLLDDDDEEVMPAEDPKSLLKCNQIWDKVQSHPKFVSGEIDMDNLCSELRSKAKCSESGVVIDKKDVENILGKPDLVPSMWTL